MSADDEAARKARARQLREQIKQMRRTEGDAKGPEDDGAAPPPENPRDFIHRKMHDLDNKREG